MMEEAESLPDPPIERERSTRALLESQNQLRAELADSRLLQQISSALIGEDRIDEFYAKLLDAAAAIMRADFASMQMFHPTKGQLQLLAHKNFPDDAAAFWEWVEPVKAVPADRRLLQRSVRSLPISNPAPSWRARTT